MDKLVPTRERFTYEEGEIEVEHFHRYELAKPLAKGKRVLDIASGEGYGSNLLSQAADHVTGVDISKECVEYANRTYGSAKLEFKHGEAASIPMPDASVGMVVSFETIEHHDQHDKMLQEIRRVLTPGGVLVISSPDKKNYSDVPGFQNEYHVKELYFGEFKELITKYFQHSQFYFQRMVKGSLVLPEKDKGSEFVVLAKKSGQELQIERKGFEPLYEICVASDGEVPVLGSSLFDAEQILREEFRKLLETEQAKYWNVVGSPTWKVGNAVLKPFKWFRGLVRSDG